MRPNNPQATGNNPPLPKLAYTRVEAAQLLGVSPATIDRLRKRKLLNPSLAVRRPLYPHAELERFLRDTSAATGVEPT